MPSGGGCSWRVPHALHVHSENVSVAPRVRAISPQLGRVASVSLRRPETRGESGSSARATTAPALTWMRPTPHGSVRSSVGRYPLFRAHTPRPAQKHAAARPTRGLLAAAQPLAEPAHSRPARSPRGRPTRSPAGAPPHTEPQPRHRPPATSPSATRSPLALARNPSPRPKPKPNPRLSLRRTPPRASSPASSGRCRLGSSWR